MLPPLIDQFPEGRLSRAAEAALSRRIQKGSEAAQNELVLATMRQALLYTYRTSNGTVADDERVSLCYQRLMRAAKRFDPSRGRFFAFAKAGLRGLMKTYWEDIGIVRNAEEIVSLDALEPKPNAPDESLLPCPSRRRGREQLTGEIAEPEFDAIYSRDEWSELLKRAGKKLDSRHRMVISLIYRGGLNGPEIGKLMGVTRSRVHAIHREALEIIRDAVGPGGRLLTDR